MTSVGTAKSAEPVTSVATAKNAEPVTSVVTPSKDTELEKRIGELEKQLGEKEKMMVKIRALAKKYKGRLPLFMQLVCTALIPEVTFVIFYYNVSYCLQVLTVYRRSGVLFQFLTLSQLCGRYPNPASLQN